MDEPIADGFEYGLEFASVDDAGRIHAAVTNARAYLLSNQSHPRRMPALVKAWLHARGAGAEVTGGTSTAEETVAAVVEQLIVTAVAAAEGTESSAQARGAGTAAPPQGGLSGSSNVGTSGGAAKAGLAKFSREVEDQYRQRAMNPTFQNMHD